jgi:sulfite exporter TauE/SafE
VHAGRIVGYALLGLVDAFVPAAVATYAVWTVLAWSVAAYAGIAALAVGLLLGAASAARGGRPFPLTRGARRLAARFWWV